MNDLEFRSHPAGTTCAAPHVAHARVVELGMHAPEGGVELTRGGAAGELMVIRGIAPTPEPDAAQPLRLSQAGRWARVSAPRTTERT